MYDKKPFMAKELKTLLAENLSGLMHESFNLNTQMKVRTASQVRNPVTNALISPGLTQSTIQRILAADVNINLDTLQRLAEVFDVSPAALISDKNTLGNEIAHKVSDFSYLLIDQFEALPADQKLRAAAFNACVVALSIVLAQHGQQKPAPSQAVKLKKARE
jgi:transcriptional regulator with XRE-family HTH domain